MRAKIIASIFAVLVATQPLPSAINWPGNSTTMADCGSDSSLDNIAAGTIVAWIKPAKLQNDNGIFTKNGGSAGPTFFQHTTSGNLRLDIPRATTNLVVQANSNELAANQWSFVAARWDVNGVDGDQQLYWGNLTTILAEVGGYAFQQVGSGAQADDSANNAVWGNMRSGGVGWGRYDGDIAIGILFDRKLSLSELKVLQFKILPLDTNTIFFTHFGYNGTATQPDWSGSGNNCTLTGSPSVVSHVPLGEPF